MVSGAEKSAVRVQVDPGRAGLDGLEPGKHADIPRQANVDLPKGSIDGASASYTIESNDQLCDAPDYRRCILAQQQRRAGAAGRSGHVVDGVENSRQAGWCTDDAGGAGDHLQAGRRQCDRDRGPHPGGAAADPEMDAAGDQAVADRATARRRSARRSRTCEFTLLLTVALVVMVIFLFLRRFWPTFIAEHHRAAGNWRAHWPSCTCSALQPGQPFPDGHHHLGRLRGR